MTDEDIRRLVVSPSRSFNVRAPAGSGKTGLLTQRALALLASVDRPEEVLCITFTRKAAGEMRRRIIQALQDAAAQNVPDDDFARHTRELAQRVLARDADKNWNLRAHPNRLAIETIDSLCARLARHFPVVSELGAAQQISDVPEELYNRAAQKLLQKLEHDEVGDDLENILSPLNNNLPRLCDYLSQLLAQRDQWLIFLIHLAQEKQADAIAAQMRDTLRRVIKAHLQRLAAALDNLGVDPEKLLSLMRHSADNLGEEAVFTLADDPEQIDGWRKLGGLLLTASGAIRKVVNKNVGFPAQDPRKEEMTAMLTSLREESADVIDDFAADLAAVDLIPKLDADNSHLYSMARILAELTSDLEEVFRTDNSADFIGVALAANRALGTPDDPTDLMLALDYRIKHILVDEFQDTSAAQVELLKRLAAGWEEGDGRTLFLVGDPMQSCYAFRGANLPMYLNVREKGVGQTCPQRQELSRNFRSTPTLIEWCNRVFRDAFPQQEDLAAGATPFAPAQAVKEESADSEVRFFATIPQEDDSSAQREAREARCITAQVQCLLHDYPDDKIGILVRSRLHLRAILAHFVAAGISWQAADVDSLASRATVMDLLCLTRALDNTMDRVAWLALLRTPWFGFDNRDLWAIGRVGDEIRLFDVLDARAHLLSSRGQKALARGLPILQRALALRGEVDMPTLVESAWIELGGAAGLDTAAERDARAFFELLAQHGGRPSVAQLEDEVEILYAAPDPNGDERVQVMTIHKAKGLEFDSVILPGLHRQTYSGGDDLLLWYQTENGFLWDVKLKDGEGTLFNYLSGHLIKRKEHWERVRLMYIACTRAVQRLYLYGEVKGDSGDWSPPARSLLASVWKWAAEAMETDAPEWQGRGDDERSDDILPRFAAAWQMPPPPPNFAALTQDAADDDDDAQNYEARALGVVTHRLLEAAARRGWPAQVDENALADDFAELQIAPERQLPLAQKAIVYMNNVRNDPRGHWLFADPTIQREAEFALSVPDGEGHWKNLFLDLLVRDGDVNWVVDYKTSAPRDKETADDFYAREMAQYRTQLLSYMAAMRLLEPHKTLCAGLYFPAMSPPGWVPLEE